MLRMVTPENWNLCKLPDDHRRQRLLSPPSPERVVASLISEATHAAEHGEIYLHWQEACDRPGYFRLHAQIPVTECTFDLLFNGRSGYRAQFYLSAEEGVLYNREIIEGLIPAIRTAYDRKALHTTLALIERSLSTPHSKIWVFDEAKAFGSATADTLNPPRWVKCSATVERKCPLLDFPKIDIKGSFIDPYTPDFFVDELKVNRACELHHKGFS